MKNSRTQLYQVMIMAITVSCIAACTKSSDNSKARDDAGFYIKGINNGLIVLDPYTDTTFNPEVVYKKGDEAIDTSQFIFNWRFLKAEQGSYGTAVLSTLPALSRSPYIRVDSGSLFFKTFFGSIVGVNALASVGERIAGYLEVTEKQTGAKATKNFEILFQPPVFCGFSLLCERGGQSLLGALAYRNQYDFTPVRNVLAKMRFKDTVFAGSPLSIATIPVYFDSTFGRERNISSHVNLVHTNWGMRVLPTNTGVWFPNFEGVFLNKINGYIPGNSGHPMSVKQVPNATALLLKQDNRVFVGLPFSGRGNRPVSSGFKYGSFGNNSNIPVNNHNFLINPGNVNLYEANHYFGYVNPPGFPESNFTLNLVVYDEERLLFHILRESGSSGTESDWAPGTGVDLSKFKLEFLDGTFNGLDPESYTKPELIKLYAVFRETATNDAWCLSFDMSGRGYQWNRINGARFGEIGNICVSALFNVIFYTKDNTVYSYNPRSNDVFNVLSFPGEVISKMKFPRIRDLRYSNEHRAYSNSKGSTPPLKVLPELYGSEYWKDYQAGLDNQLIVCTYKAGDPAYTGNIGFYQVTGSAVPPLKLKSYGGFAKIVDFSFNPPSR